MAEALCYRVEVLGGGMKGARPGDLEQLLNECAEQGWSLHSFSHQPNSNRLWVVLSSDVAETGQEARRKKGWSLNWG
jgi:hypothetical protein